MAKLRGHEQTIEEKDYFIVLDKDCGDIIFEGTVEQYDNCFGIAVNPTFEQCWAHAHDQGWSVFRKYAPIKD